MFRTQKFSNAATSFNGTLVFSLVVLEFSNSSVQFHYLHMQLVKIGFKGKHTILISRANYTIRAHGTPPRLGLRPNIPPTPFKHRHSFL